MAISFSCECGQEFRVNDSHAGKRIKCQGCGSAVKIPGLPGVKKSTSDSGGVAVGKAKKKSAKAVDEEDDPLVPSTSDYDSAYEFDIGNVPRGKLIEGEDAGPGKKSKKGEGKDAAKVKKKKPKDEDAANPILIGVFVVMGLCSLSALGYFGFQKFGSAASSAPLEKKFVTFKHDIGWSLEHPDDWTPKASGGSGGQPPVVLFEGDGAIFRMKGSIGGSMIGSMMQTGGSAGIAMPGADDPAPAVGGAGDETPETKIHLFQQELFKNDYKNFDETPPQKITPPFGEGRISVFTGTEGLFSKVKGYRATFLANDYQYNVRAYVPEAQWEKFEPTFKRMIMSLSR
jgi:hypothetical protein